MLANRVREYTATTGTGDITLAGAIAGHVRFTDAFADGDTLLYVIEDGDNYEIGTGHLAGGTTLVRATVTETLEGGVLQRAGATPISLSGSASIYCAATAQYLETLGSTADIITEATEHAGVQVDGVLLKDSIVSADSAEFITDVALGGDVSANGDIIAAGDFSAGGEITATGNITSSGNITATGKITASDLAITIDGTPRLFWDTSTHQTMWNFGDVHTLGTRSLRRGADNSFITLSGGETDITGANLVLTGSSYSTPDAFMFRVNVDTVLSYADAIDAWSFRGKKLTDVADASITGSVMVGSPLSSAQVGLKSDGISTIGYSLENAVNSNRIFEVRTDAANNAVLGLKNNAGLEKITLDGGAGHGTFTGGVSLGGDITVAHGASPRVTLLDTGTGNRNEIVGNDNGMQFLVDRDSQSGNNYFSWHADEQKWMSLFDATAPTGVLQVRGGQSITLLVGSDTNAPQTITDGVNKAARLAVPHHDNSEEPMALLHGHNSASENIINIGGGSSIMNAATRVGMWLADDTSTVTGTERWRFAGDSLIGTQGVNTLHKMAADGHLVFSGGEAADDGANLILFGSAHATQAGDVQFRNNNSSILHYDATVGQWHFGNKWLNAVNYLTRGVDNSTLYLSGGTGTNYGANLVLYGQEHAVSPGDIWFRSDAINILTFNASEKVWNFRENNIINAGNLTLNGNDIIRDVETDRIRVSGGTSGSLGSNFTLYGASHVRV